MRSMIMRRDEALGGSPVRARREHVGGPERPPTRIVTWPPGCGSFWPFGQTRSSRRCRSGRSGRRSAWRGRRRRRAPPGARRRGCACPRGRRTGSGPRRGSAWRAGTPRRRRRRDRPGGRRRCAAAQPTIGQANSSFLPSQWIRRPSVGHQPRADDDRVEVRGVVGGEDDRPLARDLVDGASTLTRLMTRPKIRPPVVSAAISGVIELSIGSGASLMRRAARLAARASVIGGAACLGVADGVDDGVDRVLEAVAVGRDDPGVRRGPERRDGAGRVELVAPAERVEDGLRLRARPGRGRAPRSGGGRAPRPTRRGRS